MKAIVRLLVITCLLLSCSSSNREKSVDRAELSNIDYRVFQNTPAWQLAKAVQDEDTEEIDKIVSENPRIINYQDSKYGNTLLIPNRSLEKASCHFLMTAIRKTALYMLDP